MDSETMSLGCAAQILFNPVGTVLAVVIQTMLNFLYLPVNIFGITAPHITSALTGGFCNF